MIRKLLTGLTVVLMFTVSMTAYAVQGSKFLDVSDNAWYADAVNYCIENKIMSGITENMFAPDIDTSRAMLITMLYRQNHSPNVEKETSFIDVKEDDWYAHGAAWAIDNHIISGYETGYFGPNDSVTREQITAILWRIAGSPQTEVTDIGFDDEHMVSRYAVQAVAWARKNGIIRGDTDNMFYPQNSVSRAETASILYNYIKRETSTTTEESEIQQDTLDISQIKESFIDLNITVGGSTFSAKLYSNDTTKKLVEQMPMTITMGDMNGNEKYYFMSSSFPTNSERPEQINSGDIMLYGSDCLVLFYESFSSSYSYTRLGYIEDAAGFSDIAGRRSVQVTFDLK